MWKSRFAGWNSTRDVRGHFYFVDLHAARHKKIGAKNCIRKNKIVSMKSLRFVSAFPLKFITRSLKLQLIDLTIYFSSCQWFNRRRFIAVYCSISNDCLLCDDIREVLERKFQKIRMFRRCLVRRCPIEAQKSINRTLHDFEYDTACIIRSSSSEFRESFFVWDSDITSTMTLFYSVALEIKLRFSCHRIRRLLIAVQCNFNGRCLKPLIISWAPQQVVKVFLRDSSTWKGYAKHKIPVVK